MDEYDLIVVGGGPAGSSLAQALSHRGWRVLIMDKARFPRDKTCAGWVTPAVLESLEVNPEAYGREHVLQPIHSFRVGLMGQKSVKTDHGEEPVSYGIRRCEFDNYLLERSGADMALGEKLHDLRRREGFWELNKRFRAPWLVGAGGHFCPVAARLGGGPGGYEQPVTAKEVEFEMTREQQQRCGAQGDTPELWFCRDLKGYGWVFRKEEYLNIGLGRQENRQLSAHLEEFVRFMQDAGRIPGDLPRRYKGHAYLLHGHARRPLTDDHCLLVGDAAGLAYDQSGEGIRPAVESSLLAADLLARMGDRPETVVAEYDRAIRARFGRRGDEAGSVRLPEWLKAIVAPPLMRTDWFTRKVVTEKWFLHTDVPLLHLSA